MTQLMLLLTIVITTQAVNSLTYYTVLINEVQNNALAYVPRVRNAKEVANCDIMLHQSSLFIENKVNFITSNDTANETVLSRVELLRRPYYYRESYLNTGASFRRMRKLQVELKWNGIEMWKNCKCLLRV